MKWSYRTPRPKADWISLAVLVGTALIGIYLLPDYGLNWDEPGNIRYGDLLRHYYTSGLTDKTVFEFSNLYYYGGAFDLTASFIAHIMDWPIIDVRHSFGLLIGLAGGILCWWCARRMAGPWAGLIALVTVFTTPLYWGHSMINSKDLPFAVAMLAIAAALISAFRSWPKPKKRHVIVLGVAIGMALSLRVGAVIAGVIYMVILALRIYERPEGTSLRQACQEALQFSLRLSPALLVAFPIMAFFWPWVVQDARNFIEAILLFSKFSFDGKELFDGTVQLAADMPWYYVPLLLLYQLPEGLIIGLPIVVFGLWWKDHKHPFTFALQILLCFVLVPLVWVLLTKPVLYNGIRHMLFIVPPIIVLISAGFAALYTRLPPLVRIAALAALLVSWGVNIHTAHRLHPYQYAAFNHFIGGVKGAEGKFAVDYWGLSLKEAVEELTYELQELEPITANDVWRIWVCGEEETIRMQFPPNMVLATSPQEADYIISLNAFYCERFDHYPKLFEIKRAGAVLAEIYAAPNPQPAEEPGPVDGK